MERSRRHITIWGPLARAALTAAALLLLAATLPRLAGAAEPSPADEERILRLSYSIALGGFHVGAADIEATLAGQAYDMSGTFRTDGFIERFFQAVYELESRGDVGAAQMEPQTFRSRSNEPRRQREREVVLRYGKDGLAEMTAEPPYDDGYGPGIYTSHRRDTLDPLSALLMPISGSASPCERTIPVFDGRRRYDLKLSPDGEANMKIGGYEGPLTRCKVSVMPVGGERKAVLSALQQENSIRIWLAPADGGRLWVPLRATLRTPLGGAVAMATDFQTASR